MTVRCHDCDTAVIVLKVDGGTVKLDPLPVPVGDYAVLSRLYGRDRFKPPVGYRLTEDQPLLPGYRAFRDHTPECLRLKPRPTPRGVPA